MDIEEENETRLPSGGIHAASIVIMVLAIVFFLLTRFVS